MRPRALAAALLVAAGLLAPLAAPPAALAGSESFVSGSTTYTLAPAERAVHVAVDLSFRNTKPDTTSVRYYFTGYRVGLQKEASGVRATHAGSRLATKLNDRGDYLELDVSFGTRVLHGQTFGFRVQYDLPDAGPRGEGTIRVGDAIAAFYAWSYGADRASVRIVLPPGFSPSTQGDPVKTATSASGTVLSASDISDRDRWFVWVTAERPAALASTSLTVPIDGRDERLEVRAFPEDALWGQTVRDRLARGLPVLGELIGLPWPVPGTLQVSEAYAPLLGGYAGFYRQAEGPGGVAEIRVTEDPDTLVILHEASHAWFNGDLFEERWINEGLANEYAALALRQLGEVGRDPEPVAPADRAAFGLNGWPSPSRIEDQQTDAAERYGYNASWLVMRRLLAGIGLQRMRLILAAADGHQIAYVGRPAPEPAASPGAVDWRAFLDLLEQVGGAKDAEALFGTWVVTAGQRADLSAHTEGVASYQELVQQGHGWLPGLVVRRPLAAWDFAAAGAAMTEARTILGERDQIDGLAQSLGLATPDVLQRAYEEAASDLATAMRVAGQEQDALEAIRDAQATVSAEHDLFVLIGLVGSTPQAELDAAAGAFTAADFDAAQRHAGEAAATIGSAATVGQQRAVAGGGMTLVLVLAGGTLLVVRRRRRVADNAPAQVTAEGRPAVPEAIPHEAVVRSPEAAATLAAGPGAPRSSAVRPGEERESPPP